MTEFDWRARYEQEATAELASYNKRPVAELVRQVKERRYSTYFSIWHSLGRRATLEQAGWALLEVLKSEPEYLHRYHCASALLALMGKSRAEAVHYSSDKVDRWANLEVLEKELRERIGPIEEMP
jgi:hypothetical protein